jgi:hypothetical protein
MLHTYRFNDLSAETVLIATVVKKSKKCNSLRSERKRGTLMTLCCAQWEASREIVKNCKIIFKSCSTLKIILEAFIFLNAHSVIAVLCQNLKSNV